MMKDKLPDYRRLLDDRYSRHPTPKELKVYKLKSITREDGEKGYKIKSYDFHIVENFRKFSGKFYPILLSDVEIKAIRDRKLHFKILKLYLLIKSATDSGRFGLWTHFKPFSKYFDNSFIYRVFSNGIELGYWDMFKVARLEYKKMPRFVIYLNKWWRDNE